MAKRKRCETVYCDNWAIPGKSVCGECLYLDNDDDDDYAAQEQAEEPGSLFDAYD